jgi:hypothetical protein
MRSLDRRGFLGLAATATAGAAGLAAGTGPARALSFEESDPAREKLMLEACETPKTHQRLFRDLVAQLEPREGREAAERQVAAMSCPLCGCPLAPRG